MSYGGEKRTHRRFMVHGIEGSLLSAPDVSIQNISFDGVHIETSKRLSIGQIYTLKIHTGTMNLTLKGMTAWCTLTGTTPLGSGQHMPIYSAGLQFVNEKTDMLRKFIQETRAHRIEQRIGSIRFRVTGCHEATVFSNCRVRQLSRGGMEVIACDAMDVESSVDVELDFEHGVVEVTCRVANQTLNEDGEQARIGLEFLEFRRDGRELLNRFIDDLESD